MRELSSIIEVGRIDRLRSVVRLINKDDAVAALVAASNQVGEAYLFGGIVRDALFGWNGVYGDVDIFVSGPLDDVFAESLSRFSRRTNFGGMRLVVGRFDVDIWELAKSRAFRLERGAEKSIKGLLSTVCFSTDAVAVSLCTGRIYSSPAFRVSAKTGYVAFVSAPAELEILQVVRIARIAVKNSLLPDVRVGEYFIRGVERFGVDGLVAAEDKWKGRRVLDSTLLSRLAEWCSIPERAYLQPPDAIFSPPSLFPLSGEAGLSRDSE